MREHERVGGNGRSVTHSYPNYAFVKLLSAKKKLFEGGTVIQRNIVLDEDGSFRWRGMYDGFGADSTNLCPLAA